MKRTLALICTLLLIISLSACNNMPENDSTSDEKPTENTEQNEKNEEKGKEEKEVMEENGKKQNEVENVVEYEDETVRILVNMSNGTTKSADVSKLALIDYINSSEYNEFLYEDAKDKLDFKNISDEFYSGVTIYETVKSPYNGINKNFEKKVDKAILEQFNDFYYLGDNYYAGSKAIAEGDDNYETKLHQGEYGRDYRLNAIYDGKNISEFKYFIIRYLGDDIFYLFDGNKFEFINMKTKEPAYKFVNQKFNFTNVKSYDGLKVCTNGRTQLLITDKKYMINKQSYNFDSCYVETKLKNRSFMLNTYPKVYTKNDEIDKKINNKILELFNFDTDLKTEHLYNEDKTSVAFVSNTYCDVKNKGNYLSVAEIMYTNGFGAHPNYGTLYYVFDLTNGELVTFDDLFLNRDSATWLILRILADETLRRKNEIMPFELKTLEGEYSDEDLRRIFLVLSNREFIFYLGDKGLVISYQPYAIAPFVAGEIEYVISYEALKPYFKEGIAEKLGIQ